MQSERPEASRGRTQHLPSREWSGLTVLAEMAHDRGKEKMMINDKNVKDTKRSDLIYSRYRNSLLAIKTRATLAHASCADTLNSTEASSTFSIRDISSGRAGRP